MNITLPQCGGMLRLLISLCLLSLTAGAASTYHVDTTNAAASDVNPGTALLPWKTLAKAGTAAGPGDLVITHPGVYDGLTNPISGTVANQVTYTGIRDVNGEYLTIIDPGRPMVSWVLASEGSNGVYKTTGLPAAIRELTVGAARQRMMFLYSPGDITELGISFVFTNSGISNGLQFLSLPANALLTNAVLQANGLIPIPIWDVLPGLFASTGSVCYVRFKNGEDPNTMDIRGLDANDEIIGGTEIHRAAVMLDTSSHTTWSNFWIRGSPSGIQMRNLANGHVVTSCKFTGCHVPIYVYTSSPPGGYRNSIVNNQINGNTFGWTNTGAWGSAEANENLLSGIRNMNYTFMKYLMGGGTNGGGGSDYFDGIFLFDSGNSNLITGNTISNSFGNGLQLRGNIVNPMSDIEVSSNTIVGFPSTAIVLYDGLRNVHIFENDIRDGNALMREKQPDDVGGETNYSVFIYRNRFWNPPLYGDQLYYYWDNATGSTYHGTNWNYQNSYKGGYRFLGLSGFFVDNGGLPNHHFLNDLASGFDLWLGGPPNGWQNAGMIGEFDYNMVLTNGLAIVQWRGAHCIQAAETNWVAADYSFSLSYGSRAIDAGLDIPTTYPFLPRDGTPRLGTAWDIGALEFVSGIERVVTGELRVGNLIMR